MPHFVYGVGAQSPVLTLGDVVLGLEPANAVTEFSYVSFIGGQGVKVLMEVLVKAKSERESERERERESERERERERARGRERERERNISVDI